MRARKRFGQHFLHDPAIIARIVAAIGLHPGDAAVEIGPGQGALTSRLLAAAGQLDAIEIDRELAAALRERFASEPRWRLHESDALEFDWRALAAARGARLRVVGNLPYNISTPLLFRLLDAADVIFDMHFMLQKEVVDRMASEAGGKEYGRLTVMLAAYAEVEHLFDVGPGAFQPRPKVWSAIVRLRPSPQPRFEIGSDKTLRAIVSAAFSHRRKTLRNGLKGLLSAEDIETCGIDSGLRPETLAPAQFGRLAALHHRKLAAAALQSP
jgi:16S rRNA (adenine1518-N6/adenine1519-N6)-dimethyltransferase